MDGSGVEGMDEVVFAILRVIGGPGDRADVYDPADRVFFEEVEKDGEGAGAVADSVVHNKVLANLLNYLVKFGCKGKKFYRSK